MTITDPATLHAMEAAFAARDRAQDGRFVVAVTTTGIYCRPSCPARRPRPENTRYFSANRDAEAAGFRPCKRCKPDEAARDEQAVQDAIAAIRAAEAPVPLDALGELTGYSPAHFQRMFKRLTGLSPAAYARALREERAREALSGGGAVTDAIYEAGFEAPSRFYEAMKGRLGMAPSAWARGGEGVTINWAVVETTLGAMLIAATEKGVCRLSFDEGRDELAAIFPKADLAEGGAEFSDLLERVVAAVEAPGTGLDIPLDIKGTAFQEAVWRELLRIPAGETRSYSQIAAAAGNPKAVRAAGSANGANHVAVLIPCHRVLRSDGSIGGYAYGTAIKEELLRRERG
ncbi:MAG: bifunctional DNA-binding transcriptional regulator/O6-methylguanine-DNA methyltransferase Ada [Candidatus Andeanibacterium colombiense]|uniref:methylated-DNA--[protein]-cysteine S-methyltransferase n=1 Tax=Candidatus Andeanibacterium colombiense TaxID=3121345 RepID=A0AAJ6BR52_9SPHN|nr:MAG: bifunctional DNA-binding transcriptional regulator/O6-methylguanine-DNA methyltransferase Ada [Sphingomonadaceae bacterium]